MKFSGKVWLTLILQVRTLTPENTLLEKQPGEGFKFTPAFLGLNKTPDSFTQNF